jgi:signal transduction histidine kinase
LLNLLLNALQAIDVQSNASQGSVGQGNVVQSNDSHPDHAKGKITVTVKGLGNAALIEVADNGRGIPSDQLPSIFRPFYTTKGEGTGLGLSLARRIVEDHQGRIDVASAVGQGTTFAVVLPLQRAAVPVSGS